MSQRRNRPGTPLHFVRAGPRDIREVLAAALAACRRAPLADATLISLSGLSPVLPESLTILSADSLQPAEVGEATARVRDLTQAMKCNRIRRLRTCGFDAATTRHLSDPHTPNLM
jgi:hypothetical protein